MIKTRHEIPLKRRRLKKTNYSKRLALLKSGKPRIVVRRSNKYIRAQIITYDSSGDKTIASAFSRELNTFGFNGTKNIPSCYLTGYLLGKRSIKAGIKEAIVDFGLQTACHKSRLFALVKGVLDAGLKVPFERETLPSEETISGRAIQNYANSLGAEYSKRFSECLKKGFDPKNIVKQFNETKAKINEGFA